MIPDTVFEEMAREIQTIFTGLYSYRKKQLLIDYLKEKLTPMFEFNSALSETWNNEEDKVWEDL